MITQLSEETIAEYASDAQTIQAPQGADFSQGVRVGRTIPAKWWNWLFNALTRRLSQGKNDLQNMLTEMQNVVTDAGITLDSSDNDQMAEAVHLKTDASVERYVELKRGFFTRWVSTEIPSYGSHVYDSVALDKSALYAIYSPQDPYEHPRVGTDTLYATFMADERGYTPIVAFQLPNVIYPAYGGGIILCRFRGRYFALVRGQSEITYGSVHTSALFVSNDLINWTKVRDIVVRSSLNNNVQYLKPCMGFTGEALYIMCYEGTLGSNIEGHLWRTKDGYNWDDVAPDFGATLGYRSLPVDGELVPYPGGFAWGQFIFGGTTLTAVLTSSRPEFNIANPIIFGSGKALYRMDDNVYLADALGQVPVLQGVTISGDYAFTSPDGSKLVFIQPNPNNSEWVTAVSLVDDSMNITAMTQPPRGSSTHQFRPFRKGNIVYCYRHKSTDLVNWTHIDSLPQTGGDEAVLYDCLPDSVLGFDAYWDNGKNYVSINDGNSWEMVPGTYKVRKGSIVKTSFCANAETEVTAGGATIRSTYVTFNSINRVLGHTLYLR